ncbi:MAG: hypothetical protein M5R40_15855 [Anaerolineae bacterium]|nr:hypothetical protein [Anaerolineae bacterium]
MISLDEKTHKYAQAVAQHRQIDVSAALLLLVQEGIKRIAHRRINTGNQEVTIKLDRADLEAVTAMAQERGIEIPEAVCILVKRALLRKAHPPGV